MGDQVADHQYEYDDRNIEIGVEAASTMRHNGVFRHEHSAQCTDESRVGGCDRRTRA